MTTDWKQVAETLKVAWRQAVMPDVHQQVALSRAIALCLLAAKLPPDEAERVLEAAAPEDVMKPRNCPGCGAALSPDELANENEDCNECGEVLLAEWQRSQNK